jgi:hypothetical protein
LAQTKKKASFDSEVLAKEIMKQSVKDAQKKKKQSLDQS